MRESEYIIVSQLKLLALIYEALIQAGPPTEDGLFPKDEYQNVMRTVHRWVSSGYKRVGDLMVEE